MEPNMVPILAALLLGPSVEPQVAFVARLYYPPEDKRESFPQVYMCRLDGSNRRQLTFRQRDDIWSVQWLGRDHLVYSILGDHGDHDRIVIYSLERQRAIRTIKLLRDHRMFDLGRRGYPVIDEDDRGYYELGVSGSRTPLVERTNVIGRARWSWTTSEGASITRLNAPTDVALRYRIGRRTFQVDLNGFLMWLVRGPKQGTDYLIANRGGESWGDEISLYRFNAKAGKADRILTSVGTLDFDPRSRYWSAVEAARPLGDYGDHRVWTSNLYVGDFMSGRRWLIAKGLVQGTCVQIRPGI